MSFNKNIKQVSCIKVPNLMVSCKQYFASLIQVKNGKTNSCGFLIAYFGTEKFTVRKQKADHNGRILIFDVSVKDYEYILINLHNANREKNKLKYWVTYLHY